MRGAGRFAPTPTGRLHLGNVRTALLSWLWARSTGRANVLRMEDLDPAAVPAGAIDGLYADLDWLGLTYDESPLRGGPVGPYAQSARFDLYTAPLAALNALGLLYSCHCSRKEVAQAALAPHVGDEGPLYPGTCRPLEPAPLASLAPAELPQRHGKRACLRLNVTAALAKLGLRTLAFEDAICGPLAFDLPAVSGDFVVQRADGLCAYQLACAFDDVAMGCDQVLRGVDLLTSAARQVLLLRLLGLREPRYAHVGLVLTPTGEKLSKRDGAIAIAEVRARGGAPRDVLGMLAALSGLPVEGDLESWASVFGLKPGWRDNVRLPGD